MEADKLYVKTIFVNEGPTLKRFRPRAHGRAYEIFKRTSHVVIVVSDEK
nr:50S ribosomal protein [Mycoplasma capricolum subsp. capricolum ATCC 27343]